MAQIRTDTIGGVNTFLQSQQEAPGDCTFTLVQFDSTAIETIVDARPIKSVAPPGPRKDLRSPRQHAAL